MDLEVHKESNCNARASEPAPNGYAGAYAPVAPTRDTGRAILGPDGSTKIVRAIPGSIAARETDGFVTCIGIPDAREAMVERQTKDRPIKMVGRLEKVGTAAALRRPLSPQIINRNL